MLIETDALIVGAGPVGLFTAFQLGLHGIQAHLVDVLDQAGGQCVELYRDKPIYDIAAVPVCTGQELTERLLQQIQPFSPNFHFSQQVSALERHNDGRWLVQTTQSGRPHQRFLSRSVVIAAGVGAFVPKGIKIDGLADFEGRQLFYRLDPAARFAARRVVVYGGEDAAVRAAIALARPGPQQAASVTLVHRRDVLQAEADALSDLAALRASGQVRFIAAQISGIERQRHAAHDLISALRLDLPDGSSQTLPLDDLLVCLGISPKLGPLTEWGLAMQRKQLDIDPATFSTSAPGVYAVGDIVHYPGKRKLIVSGFHEATLAAYAVAAQLHPDQPDVQQYTTSSALLQQRLGRPPLG